MVRVPGPAFPLAGALLLLAVVAPVIVVLGTVPPSEVLAAFSEPSAVAAIRVSLAASLGATLVASFLGIPAGYWLARCGARLRALCLLLLALPLAFPPIASGIIILYVLGNHSTLGAWLGMHGIVVADSLLGVSVAEFFVSGSFVAITATAAFGALDPLFEDAARTLGATEWKIFARVALPAAASNVAAGIVFAWLRAIGEYGATSIVAYHPTSLPVALYVSLAASGVREALALSYGFIVLAIAILSVAWILRRRVVV